MTVPIYITAAILAVVAAYFSDRVGKRSPFIVGFLLMMAVGFSMCIATDPKEHPRVVYAGVFVAACAIYPAFPGVIAWLSNNLSGSLKRSVGMAVQIGVGNLGGVSTAYPRIRILRPFPSVCNDARIKTVLTCGNLPYLTGHGIQLLPRPGRSPVQVGSRAGARFYRRGGCCLARVGGWLHGPEQEAGEEDGGGCAGLVHAAGAVRNGRQGCHIPLCAVKQDTRAIGW